MTASSLPATRYRKVFKIEKSTMKFYIVIFIIITFFICSCTRNDIGKDKNKYFGQARYTRHWLQKDIGKEKFQKTKMFIYKNDTIYNQRLTYHKNRIAAGSLYYTIEMADTKQDDIANCFITVHSFVDTIPKHKIVESRYNFSYTQQIGDSLFLKSEAVENSSMTAFQYQDFSKKLIEGVITGQVILQQSDSKKLNVVEILLFVSNKNNINQTIINTYKIKQ